MLRTDGLRCFSDSCQSALVSAGDGSRARLHGLERKYIRTWKTVPSGTVGMKAGLVANSAAWFIRAAGFAILQPRPGIHSKRLAPARRSIA